TLLLHVTALSTLRPPPPCPTRRSSDLGLRRSRRSRPPRRSGPDPSRRHGRSSRRPREAWGGGCRATRGARRPSGGGGCRRRACRSEEDTSELQSPDHLVCRLLFEKKND